MKYSEVYRRRQSIGRIEALMLVVSVIGLVTAVLVLLVYGWFLGLLVLLLTAICYALSRVFELLSELMGYVARIEESATRSRAGDDVEKV